MITIYKYPLKTSNTIELPEGAELLTVQIQNGEPYLWAKIDTDAPKEIKSIICVGTGHPIKFDGKYIATFIMPDLGLVFHAFEVKIK